MRPVLLLLFVVISSCKSGSNRDNNKPNGFLKVENIDKKKYNSRLCDTSNYEAHINYYLRSFHATSLDLKDCMSDSMNRFLLSLDTNCLRSTRSYEKFVCGILLKLFYHHIDCCHQSYDLFSMKVDGAKVLIDEFQRLINVRQEDRDMLSSGSVFYYIQSDSALKKDNYLNFWIKKVEHNKNFVP